MPAPRFTPETLTFLRRLRRHNDRAWFAAHRSEYDAHVKDRMTAIVEQLARDLPAFAPDLVAAPKVSMYRIHRDTRFSPDKSPYKTHVAAVFPHRELTRHGGAGLYFHVEPERVLIGAGLYAPDPRELLAIRRHLSSNLTRFRAIVESPRFRRSFGAVNGQRLTRPPKGFSADDPALEYLKLKQYLAGTDRPATFATGPRFYASLLRLFEQVSPFVRFLNEPLTGPRRRNPDPLATA